MQFKFKALVYCTKLGEICGRWASTIIEAENLQKATYLAMESFTKLCNRLKINHKNDFEYTDLTLC